MTQTSLARVLVVDDEVAQMQALCETLQDRGYATSGCVRAREALDMLQNADFDLLLTDLAMPEMDGIALLREALYIRPQLAAVIMTGEGTIGTAVEAMRCGAVDYVLKPFKIGAVIPVLQRGLAMRQLRLERASLEEHLRQHAAELETANLELDAFTRSASHDLRSPLGSVASAIMLLQMQFGDQLPEPAAHLLQLIDAEARRMLQLVDDLMRLSHLGRQTLDVQPVDVRAIVDGVVDELRRRDPDRRIEVSVEPLAPALADPSLLRQVYVNLIGNAFKFTRGHPHASVEIGCRREVGEDLYFVRDNGAGFDMARAGKLFQPFQRLHRHDDFEGSGVGLSIVQRIVERHGGGIRAQAAPGQGASFWFTLSKPTIKPIDRGDLSIGPGAAQKA